MRIGLALLASSCCITACGHGAVDTPERASLSGAEAYQLACASCHDAGTYGAPRIGNAEAWAGRSWLWEAVLFEHANKGYNDMPAKGGYTELDDATVERAADYMLRETIGAPSSD